MKLLYTRLVSLLVLGLLFAGAANASTYTLDSANTDVIGDVLITRSRDSDTLMDIARAYGVGYREIRQANPEVDIWLPGEGTRIVIPTRFLLPDAPREGIVMNRGEMRLYYYHTDPQTRKLQVTTYPVGIGRDDRQTPLGTARITMKLQNPAWYPTANVRADYASRGEALPFMVPPGPDNPLGEYALMLDLPGYLIHGTNRPDGIGMLASQGCVRLYPENIEALVHQVSVGTQVTLIDQPYKVGIHRGRLMIEVHPPVYPDSEMSAGTEEQRLISLIGDLLEQRGDEVRGDVDWELVSTVFQSADGLPTEVSRPEKN